METPDEVYTVERCGDTVVITPAVNLGELSYEQYHRWHQALEAEIRGLLEPAAGRSRNILIDCGRTVYFGSSAVGLFVRLWKGVKRAGGRIAFCGVSPLEREVLRAARLDEFWPIYASREEALAALGQ